MKERDLRGYGQSPPHPQWPDDARIAVQVVLNYEEGGENCILEGDPGSEAFLSEIIGAQPISGMRHMNMESIYEYGSRAGFWRLYREFTQRSWPVTVFAVTRALEQNPDVVPAMQSAGWEIASHGWRWIDYQHVPRDVEREHLQRSLAAHTSLTGSPPDGWYIGRTSPQTRELLWEVVGSPLYDSDSYADDLPYWVRTPTDSSHLIVPYTLDANDMRFATNQGFNCSEQFFQYLRDSFDTLYNEGRESPKMMSVGLHCRLVGRPGRIVGLKRFLDHVQKHKKVWLCRRVDIARHWHKKHPALSEV